MYCVFCGLPDVTACAGCRRWVCPRHRRRWLTRSVCVGCRRRFASVAAAQLGLAVASVGLIALIAWGVFR
jgi:hypothetical protein